MRALAQELSNAGIELMDSTTHISEHLAPQGLLAGPQVDAHTERQLAFGAPLVQSLADSDVGQSLAVLGSDVLAVEAIEGTDAMIDRAGALAKGRLGPCSRPVRPTMTGVEMSRHRSTNHRGGSKRWKPWRWSRSSDPFGSRKSAFRSRAFGRPIVGFLGSRNPSTIPRKSQIFARINVVSGHSPESPKKAFLNP